MPLSYEELRERIEHELDERKHVHVAPALGAALQLAGRGDPSLAQLAIVLAENMDPNGSYGGEQLETQASEIWAVLLSTDSETLFLERAGDSSPRARRVFSNLGLLEVDSEHGLVLFELAPGHSARELQSRSEPTLQVASSLTQMRVVPTPTQK